ncbi:MAG: DUF4037 domain-containing protein [Spirochaetales bacterium]|nr:DUF4037 domain-containing protein [Candidatus Physcosoma equi]
MTSYELLASLFSSLEEVVAVTIAGSFVAPIKDQYSDYDVYIYSTSPISREKRRELLQKLGGKVAVGVSFFEEGDEVHFESSPYLDIMYRDTKWMENEIEDVWRRHNARLGYTTCFVFNILNSKILFERDGYFTSLQKEVSGPYPEELRRNIIWKNMTMIDGDIEAPYMKQIQLACLRDDPVSMNHRTAALLASLFDVLFAYSRVLHPGEKKLEKYLRTYSVTVPTGFFESLRHTLDAAASMESLVPRLEALIQSVRDMLEEES